MESARINPKNHQGDYLLRPTYALTDKAVQNFWLRMRENTKAIYGAGAAGIFYLHSSFSCLEITRLWKELWCHIF